MKIGKILVVGVGGIGRRHVQYARTLVPEAEIVALRREARPDDAIEGVDRIVTELDEAIAFRPDVAVIATPASRHLASAKPFAEQGAHLLIEKPMSNRSEGLPALIDTCKKNGRVLMIGYNLRFHPAIAELRSLLEQKAVGRTLAVRAEVGQYLPSWRPGRDYEQTASARADLGGGVMLELSHEIDYLRWLFGDISWVSAVERRDSDLKIDVEDSAYLTLGFKAAGGEASFVATLAMDYFRRDTTRTCTVIGEKGTLFCDAINGTIERFENDSDGWEGVFSRRAARDETYLAEWAEFVDCIESGKRPTTTGADGLAAVRVIEAAKTSSSEKKVVQVS